MTRPPKSELQLLREWTRWTSGARKDYLNAILQLSPAERLRDRGASFGSIQAIFVHILDNYVWWLEYVPEERQAEYATLVAAQYDGAGLRRLNRRVDRVVREFLDALSTAKLGRIFAIQGVGGDGNPYRASLSLADIVWHLHEEELQHRGELNALFWQLGIDPPTSAWWPTTRGPKRDRTVRRG
jgi:uncharacterized damage-inducible protein DinB